MIDQMESPKKLISNSVSAVGPLAQSAEHDADNTKVVSSTLTRTILFAFKNNVIQLETIHYFKTKYAFCASYQVKNRTKEAEIFLVSMKNVYEIVCFWCLNFNRLR